MNYRVKLASGRVLSPLTLERIEAFVRKKIITGEEEAAIYPDGDWRPIRVVLKGFFPDAALAMDATVAEPLESTKVRAPMVQLETAPIVLEDYPKKETASITVTSSLHDEVTVFTHEDAPAFMLGLKRIMKFIGVVLASVGIGILGYQTILSDSSKKIAPRLGLLHLELPAFREGQSDPGKSNEAYRKAMQFYVRDTMASYRQAVALFRQSAAWDMHNVRALAMLVSSYLNVIDSSQKDDNSFAVIAKLLDMARAKSLDLPETVIADVEFYIMVHKYEVAKARIVDYTKTHARFGVEMFYYLALTFFVREEYQNAAQYIAKIPDNQVFSPKVFYLRGQIAEALLDLGTAEAEYQKAIHASPDHGKSRLRLASLLFKKGNSKLAQECLNELLDNVNLLDPLDLAAAYYLSAKLLRVRTPKQALLALERAHKLDSENRDIILELYTLRGELGQGKEADHMKQTARMYSHLRDAENLMRKGKFQDAMAPLLQAREADDDSPLPLLEMGDMFSALYDVQNARRNYEAAAKKAPENVKVWSRYIASLIQSYEWDEALHAVEKFRKLPVTQSFIDKAAGDLYQK